MCVCVFPRTHMLFTATATAVPVLLRMALIAKGRNAGKRVAHASIDILSSS